MDPVNHSECLSLCQLIESRGILGLKKHKDARQTKVFILIYLLYSVLVCIGVTKYIYSTN